MRVGCGLRSLSHGHPSVEVFTRAAFRFPKLLLEVLLLRVGIITMAIVFRVSLPKSLHGQALREIVILVAIHFRYP